MIFGEYLGSQRLLPQERFNLVPVAHERGTEYFVLGFGEASQFVIHREFLAWVGRFFSPQEELDLRC